MTKYATELPDFPDLLNAAAEWRGIPGATAIVEKDYYLCRALRALAEGYSGQFILKGGTSLSKGWQLLRRFSEDIDLLVRAETGTGKTSRHTLLKRLAGTVAGVKGFVSADVTNSQEGVHRTVSFGYPRVATDLPVLGTRIILEAGYRGSAEEAVGRRIQSIVSEFALAKGQADLAADLSPFGLEVQTLQRTFVEKLFAAHAAYVRDYAAGKARHYYDIYEMCRLPEITEFAGTADYRRSVVEVREFSQRSFEGQPLPEANSFAGSPAFNPDPNGLRALERNYKNEAGLFFTEQPPLRDVLEAIGELLPKL